MNLNELTFLDVESICGSINPSLTKIVGGRNAKPGSSPWQIVLNRDYHSKGHFCGGALISEEWVLGAAHCFDGERDPKKYVVHAGKIGFIFILEKTFFNFLCLCSIN